MGPAHLRHPDAALDLDVRDLVHLELEDPVREERFIAPRLGRLEPQERGLARGLREHEGRRTEVAEPFEKLEQFGSAVGKLGEDFEGLQRIDDDEVHSVDVFLRRERPPEELHPWLGRALADLLLDRPDVEDVDVPADPFDIETHRGHLVLEALPRLLEGHVEAPHTAFLRVPMEDRIAEGGFHRPRETREEHDVADGEAAGQHLVDALDIRRNLLRLHSPLPPVGPSQGDRTRPSESLQLPIEVGIESDPDHLGEHERADAVDWEPFVALHAEIASCMIRSTCFAARSIAMRTSPKFASSYTRATRRASSPAPRLSSFP